MRHLVQANGVDLLGVLALPVLLAGVGPVAVRRRRRGILATVMGALIAFSLLALASVGLFYLRPPQRSSLPWSAGDNSQALHSTADQHRPDECS